MRNTFHVQFFFNCAAYEVRWKNTVEPDSPQKAKGRTHISCWITKATHTNSDYVLLIVFRVDNG